ncbi:MAG: hypothetical protein RMJ18_00700 [Candidatus Aenigmarchaeota archaeon]|nr:hypothetical protein [Candidatus Aenigmarchaeota archaeon]MCX8190679.1 hypothetical protein [Candidatus Aenigmarchaeota archaeon]MDW8159928.1 hypothetical protein [Candidatus Aenigmarchaeota archaeon]
MKVKKILLPKWVAWFVFLIFLIVFIQMYYYYYNQKISPFEFFSTIALFLVIAVVLFFVSYRQIPYLLLMEVKK